MPYFFYFPKNLHFYIIHVYYRGEHEITVLVTYSLGFKDKRHNDVNYMYIQQTIKH